MRTIKRNRRLFFTNFLNATGDIPVLTITDSDQSTLMVFISTGLIGSLSVGQSVKYQYDDIIILGTINKISPSTVPNTTVLLISHSGLSLVQRGGAAQMGDIAGGTLSITSSMATNDITATSLSIQSNSPVVSSPVVSSPVISSPAPIDKSSYTQIIDTNGNLRYIPPDSLQVFVPDESIIAQVISDPTGQVKSVIPAAVPSENNLGIITPQAQTSTQPVQGNVPKTINASSIILFLVLGGIALWGINKI